MSISTAVNLTERQKFESIDIMRGIAILLVILVHTSQKIGGEMFLREFAVYGQMGVQLFFVASAFTLCYSLDVRRTNEESIMNFYIRRFFRIAPGYYAGILIFLLVNILCDISNISSAWKNSDSLTDIAANILFLHGFYPPANNSVVPGGWSIATEMLFYLIFPFLINLYNLLQSKYKYTYLVAPVVALSISLCVQYALFSFTKNPNYFANNSFIYFSIVNQLPVFCVGISLYIGYKQRLHKKYKLITNVLFFIILSFVSTYLMIQGTEIFILVNALTPFVSALSFVFLFFLLQNHKVIFSEALINIGVRSYSCYLLHILFAYFMTALLWKISSDILPPDLALILFYSLTVALTYVSSGFMYKYIELQGISLGKRVIVIKNQSRKSNINTDTAL